MYPSQGRVRGRGFWQPRQAPQDVAASGVEGTALALEPDPNGAAPPELPQQRGRNRRGQGRPRQLQEREAAGDSQDAETRQQQDGLTWQQQELMQQPQQQPLQQQQQQLQRRQRPPRPCLQRSMQPGPGPIQDGWQEQAEALGRDGLPPQEGPQPGEPQHLQQEQSAPVHGQRQLQPGRRQPREWQPRELPYVGAEGRQPGPSGSQRYPRGTPHYDDERQWYSSAPPSAPHFARWEPQQQGQFYGQGFIHGQGALGFEHLQDRPSQQQQQQQRQRQPRLRREQRRPSSQQPEQHPGDGGPGRAEDGTAAPPAEPRPGSSSHGELSDRESQPQARPLQDEQQQGAEAEELPQCVVCCSPMHEVTVGACNHKEVCGTCTLRLRLCYGRKDCPLCKMELKEVVIAPWRGKGPPDFDFYQSHPEFMARSAKWAKGIAADRWQRGRNPSNRLMYDLQRRTALACVVCDRGGQAPFPRKELLLRHVQDAHGQRLCSLCLEEGHLFALEMRPYPSFEALQGHMADAHPRCDFCSRRFYDADGLWKHMQQAHYSCHVCPPPAGAYAYFNTARDLEMHMRSDHHMCVEPECADCFVAFATLEELRRHHLERHSARMPRWDASRARPLPIDIQFVGAPLSMLRQQERAARRGRQQGGGSSQDVRQLDSSGGAHRGGGGDSGSGGEGAPGLGPARPEYARETEGGFMVFDDDLGMLSEREAGFPPETNLEPGPRPIWRPHESRTRRGQPTPTRGEDFPSLATAAAVAGAERGEGGGAGAGGAGGQAGARRPPPLVKHTVKCPCGRRQSHYVVEEGQEVPLLPCDAVCELEGRRSQLAGAFGVEHPERHVSYFDRHRTPTYSGQLLAAAQQHPKAIEALEKIFAAFLANSSSRRHSLAPMPREQRAVAHELAQQYGLASQGYGQEPGRYVELFKTDSAGIPSKLLSRVAPTVPPEEVAAMVREGSGHPIRLVDIALSCDVNYYLRRWEGEYRLEWQGGDAVVVRFEKKEDMEEALSQLGGGIRGLFKVDRSYRPRAALTADASGGRPTVAGWATGGSAGSGSGAAGDTWTAVAASAPRPAVAAQQQQPAQEEAGGAGLPSRWTVIGKAGRVRAVGAGSMAARAASGPASSLESEKNSYLGLADDAWEA